MTETSAAESHRRRLEWLIRNFWMLTLAFNLVLLLAALFFLLFVA